MAKLTLQDNILAQRTINETMGEVLKPDGAIGPASRSAIGRYQKNNELPITSQLDDATWANMQPYIAERFVTVQNIIDAAIKEGLPPSMLLAFWEVESALIGFLPNRRLNILFEGHQFYAYVSSRLGTKVAQEWHRKYPTICFPKWDPSHYRVGMGEWARFEQARALDATCAQLGTSWGLFQLMGFNFSYGGFPDVQTMVEMHNQSEHVHLRAVINYINNYRINATLVSQLGVKDLRGAVVAKNYRATARIYNGSGYATHKYDERLRAADVAWAKKV